MTEQPKACGNCFGCRAFALHRAAVKVKAILPAVRQAARPLRGQTPPRPAKRREMTQTLDELVEHATYFAEKFVPSLTQCVAETPALEQEPNLNRDDYPRGMVDLQAELQQYLAHIRSLVADMKGTRASAVTDKEAAICVDHAHFFIEVAEVMSNVMSAAQQ